MASGFFFGGMAPGISQGANAISNDMKLSQMVQLQQANQAANQKHSEFLQLRSTAVEQLGETMKQLGIAHPQWTPQQLAANPAVVAMKNQLQGFDKNLGLPDTADSIVANFAARPSEATQTRALAEASGTYGKNMAETLELQARTRVLNQAAGVGGNPDLDTDTQLGGKQFKTTGNPRVDSILQGIDKGDIPPDYKVNYSDRTAFGSGVEKNGINLAEKDLQWQEAKKQVQSLGGPQMTRYIGLNKSVQSTISEVLDLSGQMKLGGVPALNNAELQSYIQTQGNSEKGQLATKYLTAVNTLKEEFANLAQGGYAPTDPAWKLADQQINGNYGWQQLPASLSEVGKLINIRLHAIPGMDKLGPGSPNPYTGQGGSSSGSGEWSVKVIGQ